MLSIKTLTLAESASIFPSNRGSAWSRWTAFSVPCARRGGNEATTSEIIIPRLHRSNGRAVTPSRLRPCGAEGWGLRPRLFSKSPSHTADGTLQKLKGNLGFDRQSSSASGKPSLPCLPLTFTPLLTIATKSLCNAHKRTKRQAVLVFLSAHLANRSCPSSDCLFASFQ